MSMLECLGITGTDFRSLAEEILGKGERLLFRARGVSMEPFIRDGDVLEVAPYGRRDLRIGDVVLFNDRSGCVLAHRVMRIQEHRGELAIQLKGDALLTPDGWFGDDHLLGTVVTVRRGGASIRLDTWWQRVKGRVWWCWFRWLRQCGQGFKRLRRIRAFSAEERGLR